MNKQRAPRTKKRISCEIKVGDNRYAGIVLDLSASGMWIQTNAKLSQRELADAGTAVRVTLSLPGGKGTAAVEARVARMKIVPPQFLGLKHGGIGLAVTQASDEYMEFVAGISPEQAAAVEEQRKRRSAKRATPRPAADAPKRFRVHAVETTTGQRKTYLATAASEEQAGTEVLAQLGDAFQVLFVERA